MNVISIKYKVIGNRSIQFACLLFFLNISLFYSTAHAGRGDDSPYGQNDSSVSKPADAEKKVDYLEQIYFSGKNKADLLTSIQIVIQNFDGKPVTTAVAKQYAFLTGIKANAEAAEDACDITEMLAAGIFDLDANEAALQNVKRPTEKAKANAGNALATIANLTKNSSDLAVQSWYLSGGKLNALGAAGKLGGAMNSINSLSQSAGAAKKLLNSFGIGVKKDKPCKDVKAKSIEIGDHFVPDTVKLVEAAQTKETANSEAIKKIVIKNINYNQLQTVGSAIEKFPGVTSVNSDNFSGNIATIVVNSNLKVKEIVGKIMEANKSLKIEVENTTATEANLILK